jgi:F-type H+-transporting ATPase subunit a
MEIHASLKAEEILRLGPVGITNSMVMAWITMAILIVFAYFGTRNVQVIPRGAQNVLEFILEALMGLVENTAGHYARRVFPLVATLFLFIITANYLGMMPGVGTIYVANPAAAEDAAVDSHASVPVAHAGAQAAPAEAAEETEHHEPATVPLLRAANADVNMTLAMGIIAFLFIHASGVVVHGLGGYWKELSTPPVLTPVKLVIELFVPVSLSMRLFGNIFGGEMLLAVMSFPVVAVPFMAMELLFGFIQALIFTLLTLIFTSLAVYVPPGHEAGNGRAHGSVEGSRHDELVPAGHATAAPAHA